MKWLIETSSVWTPIAVFLIGWILKSPIFSDAPVWVTTTLGSLKPETIQRMLNTLASEDATVEFAALELQQLAAKEGVQIEADKAESIVRWMLKIYKTTIASIKRLGGLGSKVS